MNPGSTLNNDKLLTINAIFTLALGEWSLEVLRDSSLTQIAFMPANGQTMIDKFLK